MASLAQITSEVRTLLKILAGSLVVIVILFVVFKGGVFIKDTFFPTPPPPPEEKFGKLPRVEFPAQNPQNISYTINTVSGRLDNFGTDRMTVYKVKAEEPSLVALQAAREKARSAGFEMNEAKLNNSTYQWSSSTAERLQLNIFTNEFKVVSNFINSAPPALVTGDASQKDGAFNTVISFLGNLNEDTSDISLENSKFRYQRIVNGNLQYVESQNNAQFVRLDLFQNNIDDRPIYYPGFNESIMYFVMKSDGGTPDVVDAKFLHLTHDADNHSTYPIKSAEQAFEDLQKGNAYVLNEGKKANVDITSVKLAYYIGGEDQPYFLPIVVFEGNDFTAYVNAIPDSSIGN